MKKHCIPQNNLMDKDKEKDVCIGPKEFVLHVMMAQTKDKLSTNKNNSTKSTRCILILTKCRLVFQLTHFLFFWLAPLDYLYEDIIAPESAENAPNMFSPFNTK